MKLAFTTFLLMFSIQFKALAQKDYTQEAYQLILRMNIPDSVKITASLTTLREGVMLKRYDDAGSSAICMGDHELAKQYRSVRLIDCVNRVIYTTLINKKTIIQLLNAKKVLSPNQTQIDILADRLHQYGYTKLSNQNLFWSVYKKYQTNPRKYYNDLKQVFLLYSFVNEEYSYGVCKAHIKQFIYFTAEDIGYIQLQYINEKSINKMAQLFCNENSQSKYKWMLILKGY